jgi:hypothetical protein
MDLRHYSSAPFDLAKWRRPTQLPDPTTKPNGLWLSVGDEWMGWCRDEEYGLTHYIHEHDVTLTDGANVLKLTSTGDLDGFSRDYGRRLSSSYPSVYIDWTRVAADYEGIVIAPYQWERRYTPHTHWYYGWDVASGCIWDRAAIAEVTSMAEVPAN